MSPAVAIAVCAALIIAVIAAICALLRLQQAIRYDAGQAKHTPAAIAAAREAGEYCRVLAEPGGRPPWELPVSGRLPMPPPDPPPAETAELPVVTCELGGQTVSEFIDGVFARHTGGPVMLP